MVTEGDGEGGVDQVSDHQTFVTHLDKNLLPALMRFDWPRLWWTRDCEVWVLVIKRNEVREEGRQQVLLFGGLGRGGGEGLERRLFGFLSNMKFDVELYINCLS